MLVARNGSLRFLFALLAQRPGLVVLAALSGALWMAPTAVLPMVVGRAIDGGIRAGDTAVLLRWVLAVVALGVLQMVAAAALNWAAHTLWIHGTASAQRIVLRQVIRLGGTLTREVKAGEVVTMSASDVFKIGDLFETLGRAFGSLLAFVAAVALLLWISPPLALVVLIGVPLAMLGIGPLLRPLHRREEIQRDELGKLGAQAADIVSGLRILRGIGGERRFFSRFAATGRQVREAGIATGRIDAWLSGAEVLLPGLVTVLVTWLGARMALAGSITVGELVTFYGVSAFLVIPVRTATETAYAFASARIAAGRAAALQQVEVDPAPPVNPLPLPAGPLGLVGDDVEVPAGELVVIDAGHRGEAVAERLAGSSLAGGVRLPDVDPDERHRRVVLAHNQDLLFAGSAREAIDLGTEVDFATVVRAADAEDVLAALPPDGLLDERARLLSGGQRQRLLLARALSTDADVLVLDDPTSAVDAHTEERITERVRALRAGRTTVVLSQSPLWEAVADRHVQVEEP
ncbi:ABC transporter transmembrane domain-containing protein [Saccharopolyspora dendranthemae]|uniref:ABC-type multidrug transport system fused ATPase/permease subunit n=1 Tax=Saccharopolyspora dendranthemae TaxID=1181886 RepID=A0A561U5Y1_9PSEU|nr:ABC transporter ATP-binding protein [Saccharopolyspora dendranthemae]TWF94769.1 ABC-type multidrug transport system fused ATPase/permease subunit [Saccharopolyspora dendranthemae]